MTPTNNTEGATSL